MLCIVSFYDYDCNLPPQQLKVGLIVDAVAVSCSRVTGCTVWLSPGRIFRLREGLPHSDTAAAAAAAAAAVVELSASVTSSRLAWCIVRRHRVECDRERRSYRWYCKLQTALLSSTYGSSSTIVSLIAVVASASSLISGYRLR